MNLSEFSKFQMFCILLIIASIIALCEIVYRNKDQIKEIFKFKFEDTSLFIKIFFYIAVISVAIIPLVDGSNADSFLISLASGLLGLIITIGIIQCILDKRVAINSKNKENKNILRFHALMKLHIKNYKAALFEIITTDSWQNEFDENLPIDINLKDLYNCDKPCLLVCSLPGVSKIENYHIKEQNLASYMIKMVENIDFDYNENLKHLLIEFINTSSYTSITKNIIGYTKNKTSSGRTPHEIFKDTIITSSDKLIAEFEEGKLGGNIFYSYVFFYKALKIELDIIELYEKLILRLYDDKNNTEQFKTYG